MRGLFDLCSGFVYSQVLLACTRLELFERLAESPRTSAQLAADLGLPLASLDRLLEAAHSLNLLEYRGGLGYGLGPLGSALRGNPSVALMIEHHAAFYSDLKDPVGLLRGQRQSTELNQFWAYSGNPRPTTLTTEQTTAYSQLMAASQTLIADQVLSAYPVKRHRRLLDVGGGAGAFAAAAMTNVKTLEACVYDLPAVSRQAQERFVRSGFGGRAHVCEGDFLNDSLPPGYDLVSLVRILHDHNDDAVLKLLISIRQSMASDGVLMIAEPMLGTPGAEPVSAAYFGFYLLAMGQGRPRSKRCITALLQQAGFTSVKEFATYTPMLVRVLIAT